MKRGERIVRVAAYQRRERLLGARIFGFEAFEGRNVGGIQIIHRTRGWQRVYLQSSGNA